MEKPHSKRGSWTVTKFTEGLKGRGGWVGLVHQARGPRGLRRQLGLSQSQMGRLLGLYGHEYTKQTIAIWERAERGRRLARRYQMAEKARRAYHQLISDLVQLAGRDWQLAGRVGPRRWSLHLEAVCTSCGRPFHVRHGQARRCGRHAARRA